jgi:SAM-dependent methyltransferase
MVALPEAGHHCKKSNASELRNIMDKLRRGTAATRDFYNSVGWGREDGKLVDTLLFGWMDGPIRQALEGQRKDRLREGVGGPGLRLAELGCGGTPAVFLAERCATYTAVDFSLTGLSEAAAALKRTNVAFETIEADITDLPFEDNAFDVVYSAHAIYHIDTVDGQAAAFREAMRVLRPGGRAIFVLANPFPLLFPYRLIRRVLAMTPGLNTLLNRLRAKPPLPYLPMPLRWMKGQLGKWGDVRITGYAVPSVQFDRRVSEVTKLGRMAWRAVQRLEKYHPVLAARLGCYVLIVVTKSSPLRVDAPKGVNSAAAKTEPEHASPAATAKSVESR